ncbi:chloride channel protein CLC-e [Cucurbita moschata]|uniref:Chloride channel protein n=1 Tax=Cucurbita moschata TaxID=3662 RepID=A0A6J1G5I3_CUCMO|nr:chloride channel protein CLC-e [Cucurbita moschata]
MGAIDSIGIRLNNNAHHYPLSSSISAPNDCCSSYGRFLGLRFSLRPKRTGFRFRSFCALPGSGESESPVPGSSDGRFSRGEGSPSATGIKWSKEEEEEEDNTEEDEEEEEEEEEEGIPSGIGSSTIISSCFVGVLTGIGVVLFNNAVHELRDFFWDGIPNRGASWLREMPVEETWKRVILVPACGGFLVSFLNLLREATDNDPSTKLRVPVSISNQFRAALQPFLKAVAASVTLGTGNSLGPEGPSVDIGTSVGKGVSTVFDRNSRTKLSLIAAGSAAGISSGFNAAVAGCFFAVESVLWPSPADSTFSLTNTTSMVILSAVIASAVSQVGLGVEPAFKVPEYDFRSPSELPLYLLLGALCGLVSLSFSKCTSYMLATVDKVHKDFGVSRALFPILGGFSTGLIALAYPEILYWGFENVDLLLESRPFVKPLSAELLAQLVVVKILATSLCRASGLVGGYYAPSLFIGAATGMAYGKFIGIALSEPNTAIDFSIFEVASPQAYGLVGMAATLAGVCQVPLTAVLLLFELTQDYRIVLPLLGAVGVSSWLTSGQKRKRSSQKTKKLPLGKILSTQQTTTYDSNANDQSSNYADDGQETYPNDLCEIESSLCAYDSDSEIVELERKICVSEAMTTRYVTVFMDTFLKEAVDLMLAEKQSCALIVDEENTLIGILALEDIQKLSKNVISRTEKLKGLVVSEVFSLDGEICRVPWTATPSMDILTAKTVMKNLGVSQVPVVKDQMGYLVGVLDLECIDLTCRILATRESLS